MLVKQQCYIQTKCIDYVEKDCKWSIQSTFLGSILKPCYIQNHVIANSVIDRFVCSDTAWKSGGWGGCRKSVSHWKIVRINKSTSSILALWPVMPQSCCLLYIGMRLFPTKLTLNFIIFLYVIIQHIILDIIYREIQPTQTFAWASLKGKNLLPWGTISFLFKQYFWKGLVYRKANRMS